MNTNNNAYEKLYNDMKNQFTVMSNDCKYTLGDYMSMKADAKDAKLPAVNTADTRIAAVFSYVNDKLTVKKAPVKDRTLRAFPFRTSAASLLSAMVACALIFSYGIFTVRDNNAATVEAGETVMETEISENQND